MESELSHNDLVKAAYRWVLGSTSCGVAVRELSTGCSNGEYPDVIGFGAGMSVLVECKTSRSDFIADKKKLFRLHPELGMGTYRFYCCPTGLIKVEDLPENWGLVYVNEKGQNKTEYNPYNGNRSDYSNVWRGGFRPNQRAEHGFMYSVLRRLHKLGHMESIYKDTAQLVRCQDVNQLASVVSYIEAVEKGEVLIAEAIQAPEVPAVEVVPIAEPELESKPVPKKRAAKPKVPKVKPAKIVEQVEEVPTPITPQVATDYVLPGSGTIPKW